MELSGIDVSEANGVIDWEKVKESGEVEFVYAKATEGRTIQDARFKENHDGCKKAGIPFAPYHFFHFGSSTPEDQAANFLSVINGYEGHLLPMVDVEGASQDHIKDVGVMVHRLSQFLQIVEKTLGGKKMIIYTGYSWWQDVMNGTDCFSGHPCFVAAYNHTPDEDTPHGWKKFSLWQFSDKRSIPGAPGHVDGDVSEVPLLDLSR